MFKKEGGIGYFFKNAVAYSCKTHCVLNTESVFIEKHLPKSGQFILVIFFRPLYKIDFFKCIDEMLKQFNKPETQDCELLEANLCFRSKEIFSDNIIKIT